MREKLIKGDRGREKKDRWRKVEGGEEGKIKNKELIAEGRRREEKMECGGGEDWEKIYNEKDEKEEDWVRRRQTASLLSSSSSYFLNSARWSIYLWNKRSATPAGLLGLKTERSYSQEAIKVKNRGFMQRWRCFTKEKSPYCINSEAMRMIYWCKASTGAP